MKNSCSIILTAFWIATLHVQAIDLFKKAHPIKLKRSYQVGMKTHEVLMISNRTSFTLGDLTPRVTQQDFKLECDVTVLKVFRGYWTELDVKASKIAFPRQGKDRFFGALNVPLLITRLADVVSFKRRDGKALTPIEISLLQQFFVAPGASSPDDVFGTNQTIKPGESWSVQISNAARMLSQVTKKTMACEPRHTKGKMTFKRLWNHKGQAYQQIGGTVTYDPVSLHGDAYRTMLNPVCTFTLTINYQLPVDTELPAAKMEESYTLVLKASQRETAKGTPFTQKNTSKRTRLITILERPKKKETTNE